MDSWKIRSIPELVRELKPWRELWGTVLVGIDGPGGCGKSSLAGKLASYASEIEVVSMDDFYRPARDRQAQPADEVAADFDWRRMREQVLIPLSRADTARYQRYDWTAGRLGAWTAIASGRIVIVEGVYSTKRELRNFYRIRIWMECPPDVRLARGIERDGENARERWITDWMPEEDRYVGAEHPEQAAHLIVDGASSIAHDEETEFACLERVPIPRFFP